MTFAGSLAGNWHLTQDRKINASAQQRAKPHSLTQASYQAQLIYSSLFASLVVNQLYTRTIGLIRCN